MHGVGRGKRWGTNDGIISAKRMLTVQYSIHGGVGSRLLREVEGRVRGKGGRSQELIQYK